MLWQYNPAKWVIATWLTGSTRPNWSFGKPWNILIFFSLEFQETLAMSLGGNPLTSDPLNHVPQGSPRGASPLPVRCRISRWVRCGSPETKDPAKPSLSKTRVGHPELQRARTCPIISNQIALKQYCNYFQLGQYKAYPSEYPIISNDDEYCMILPISFRIL